MSEQSHIPRGAPPDNYDGPRRSLVLSGGGMRLSYQAGAIRALFDHGLCFHHMDGTSGGSLNLSMLLAGLDPEECCDQWRTQDPRDFAGFMSLSDYLDAGNLTAISSADGITEKVLPHLGVNAEKIRNAVGVQGTYNILNYDRKVTEVIEHQTIETDLIVAGMSLPGVMPPVVKDGTTYLDAGFMQDANPLEALRRGAEEIWLIWAMGNSRTYHGGALRIYVQMLEMSANGALNIQFERINELNHRIANGDSPYGQTRPVVLHVIRPEFPLPLDPDLLFNRIDHTSLIDMGYSDARSYLENLDPLGVTPSPSITQMKKPKLGVSFREAMSGNINFAASDPRSGEIYMALHATVNIKDIAGFQRDPKPETMFTGHVDYGTGRNIPGYNGVFTVSSDFDDPEMKTICYQLNFDLDGECHCLVGRKKIKDDPGFDFLSDICTLHTTVYAGVDVESPIVCVGILKLSMGQLIDMFRAFTTTSNFDLEDGVEVLDIFGRFLVGSLWDSYRHYALND